MGKHLRETHQLHKLFKRNNVKVSYRPLANFKSVINGHNKEKLIKQEKSSPCNCREKMSSSWNGSYQNKNLFNSCKVSTPDIKPNYRISLALRNIHLKTDFINIIVISRTSQRETQQNFLISYDVKRKRRLKWVLFGRIYHLLQLQTNVSYALQRNITFLYKESVEKKQLTGNLV